MDFLRRGRLCHLCISVYQRNGEKLRRLPTGTAAASRPVDTSSACWILATSGDTEQGGWRGTNRTSLHARVAFGAQSVTMPGLLQG